MKLEADVVIIGGGIVGATIARELSRFAVSTVLTERREDLARGASGANSGIVHAGYDPEPGSKMAYYNVKGCAMYPQMAEELEFPYQNIGSLVVAQDEKGVQILHELYERGLENGVPGMEILNGAEALALEPNLSPETKGALLAKSAGIVSPYEATIAFAENAAVNGVKFLLGNEITAIEKTADGSFRLRGAVGDITAKVVINCAGTAAGRVSDMAGAEHFEIVEKKGEYTLYDRNLGGFVKHTIFPTPDENGKGVLVTPTAEGNLLLGPSSDPLSRDQLGDTSTTQAGQDKIFAMGRKAVPNLPFAGAITGFAGIRAVSGKDFIIGPSEKVEGFIQVSGICSPGLTSAPAIAEDVAQMALEALGVSAEAVRKPDWDGHREGIPSVRDLNWQERQALCEEDPTFGTIVCRCETVTEGQIRRALKSPIPVYTIDGVKRRVRAGMGRCQGSFCTPRVMELISEAAGVPFAEVRKAGPGTEIGQGSLKNAKETEE